eukprot:COSAG06_NODE_336_length_17272_cov_50.456647_16_plen_193_part_00
MRVRMISEPQSTLTLTSMSADTAATSSSRATGSIGEAGWLCWVLAAAAGAQAFKPVCCARASELHLPIMQVQDHGAKFLPRETNCPEIRPSSSFERGAESGRADSREDTTELRLSFSWSTCRRARCAMAPVVTEALPGAPFIPPTVIPNVTPEPTVTKDTSAVKDIMQEHAPIFDFLRQKSGTFCSRPVSRL